MLCEQSVLLHEEVIFRRRLPLDRDHCSQVLQAHNAQTFTVDPSLGADQSDDGQNYYEPENLSSSIPNFSPWKQG